MGRQIELLAPARDAETARQAILHGADAIYIGASSHGARSAAANPVDDIKELAAFAHDFNARIYVTLNTLVYDDEIARVERLIRELYRAEVDALIVQDLGILRMDIPPIELHASTQCDIRTPEKARFLEDVGFSQLVLPRELTIEEIHNIRQATSVPLEAFCHGALCVSYSGDCQAGFVATGRSANRGECPQICRLRYHLVDSEGRELVHGKHLLSLRDMNRSDHIREMLEAGVSSFKIEGRLKDVAYVKNTVAAYRRILDQIIESSDGEYVRSSSGRSETAFTPDLSKSFNRGFTSYFLDNNRLADMAAKDTPKMVGERIGIVTDRQGRRLKARLDRPLQNGDGLGFFNREGEFSGFRVNRAEGNKILTAGDVEISRGTVLYRNRDKAWDDLLEGETARRTLDVSFRLALSGQLLSLEAKDERGCSVTATAMIDHQDARSPQEEQRRKALSKLGDTIYRLTSLEDTVGQAFIPASTLSSLRRDAVALLDSAWKMTRKIGYRRPEKETSYPAAALSYHENVSNRLSSDFYKNHGVNKIQPAIEVSLPRDEKRVMQTRYCIRREFGCCLKTLGGRRWKGPLYLETDRGLRYRIEFDCKRCGMDIFS